MSHLLRSSGGFNLILLSIASQTCTKHAVYRHMRILHTNYWTPPRLIQISWCSFMMCSNHCRHCLLDNDTFVYRATECESYQIWYYYLTHFTWRPMSESVCVCKVWHTARKLTWVSVCVCKVWHTARKLTWVSVCVCKVWHTARKLTWSQVPKTASNKRCPQQTPGYPSILVIWSLTLSLFQVSLFRTPWHCPACVIRI